MSRAPSLNDAPVSAPPLETTTEQDAVLYGVHHSPWVEGIRLAMAHHGLRPRLTSHPHSLGWIWKRGLVFPALRLSDGTIHVDSFSIYGLLEDRGYPLGVEAMPPKARESAQYKLERLFLNYAPGRCIHGRRWRFIQGWSQIPEAPYSTRGAISRGFVSLYFFVLIRLGIRRAQAQGRPVYDLARIEQHLQGWNEQLATARWLTGEEPGFLDFALLGHIQCMASGLTEELLPILRRQNHLLEWLARMLAKVDGTPHLHARRVLEPTAVSIHAGPVDRRWFWFAWVLAVCAWPLTGLVLVVLLARRNRNPGHSGAVVARRIRQTTGSRERSPSR